MGSKSTPPKISRIGRYEVVREIGVGAMGRVLLARDPVLERHVAIKLLRDDLGIAEDVRDGLIVRMRHEARAVARTSHPHLVTLHDMGQDDGIGLYLVFEYLEGPTLKQRIRDGRLTARQAARIARELGSALTYAHDRGILHRDVKPDNIILTDQGAKLTDFGIARVPDSTLTHGGGLLGTPAYSAPETFREGRFSHHSDQFSLAATLYEAVRGERAFPGDDAVSVASRIANDPPALFAETLQYPDELDDIFQRAMSKDLLMRFASCRDLGNALAAALVKNPSAGRTSREPATLERSGDIAALLSPRPSAAYSRTSVAPEPRRSGAQLFVFGMIGLLVLGLFVRALLRESREPDETTTSAAPLPELTATVEATSAQPLHKPRPEPRRDPTLSTANAPSATPAASASASAAPNSSAAPGASASNAPAAPTALPSSKPAAGPPTPGAPAVKSKPQAP